MKVSPLLNKVIIFIKDNYLLNRGDSCLLGVSGGFDSVVLLDLVSQIQNLFDITFAIAHINYNLRGEYSTEEENYVRELAKKYKVKFHHLSIYLKDSKKNDSLENIARNIRYDFFEKIANENSYNKIAIAHNSNDQAETILLKLIRGSISGLKGIEAKRKLSLKSNIEVIRPILCLSRDEIEKYADDKKLSPKTDLSNLEDSYKRNRVRHNILPLLLSENPNFLETVQQMGHVIGQEDKYLDELASFEYNKVLLVNDNSKIVLANDLINNYETFLQRRIFKKALQELSGEINSFSYKSLEAIRNCIENKQSNKLIELTNNYYFIKDKNYLIFSKGKPDFKTKTFSYEIKENKLLNIPETKTSIKFEKVNTEYIKFSINEIFFSCQDNFILTVTNYSDTIEFVPYNSKSEVKIKDYLNKKKVPEMVRKDLNLVFINNQLLWVAGIIRTNLNLLEDRTKMAYKLTISDS